MGGKDAMSAMSMLTMTFSQEPATKISYNVATGDEQDKEILRANMLFYNTPLTESYSYEVYSLLNNVQDQCVYDFEKNCMPEMRGFIDLNDFVQQLVAFDVNRRLSGVDNSVRGSGKRLLNYMRSLYVPSTPGNKNLKNAESAIFQVVIQLLVILLALIKSSFR